jgi:DMSO/TMAO reductase YedYZ molybdopterin-dependent catalytic subunit
VTARGTDWTLAVLVAALVATGLGSWFVVSPWMVGAHDVAGLAVGGVLTWKFARVLPVRRWRTRKIAGAVAAVLVVATLLTGVAWAFGADLGLAGYNGLAWHVALGFVLGLIVVAHMVVRARRPRRRDVVGRRQLLASAGVGALAVGAWSVQRPLSSLFGWRGADRRFTGSYEGFPVTSWVADHPREIRTARLQVAGLVREPRSVELAGDDVVTATLDCTGGFVTTQEWRGVLLGRLLDGVLGDARHVRVISHTGYRWSFSLDHARGLLLATHVAGEPLSHGHGAPARLVVPGRRGFQWVKWVTRIEVHADPDPGALASTVWSSFTPEGRGRT